MSETTTELVGERTRPIGREGFPIIKETFAVEKRINGLDLIFEDTEGGRVRHKFDSESARHLHSLIGANLPDRGRTD